MNIFDTFTDNVCLILPLSSLTYLKHFPTPSIQIFRFIMLKIIAFSNSLFISCLLISQHPLFFTKAQLADVTGNEVDSLNTSEPTAAPPTPAPTRSRSPVLVNCSVGESCLPYSRVACNRNSKINFRFRLELPSQNWWLDDSTPRQLMKSVTYAFCPRVDQVSALTFRGIGRLALIFNTSDFWVPTEEPTSEPTPEPTPEPTEASTDEADDAEITGGRRQMEVEVDNTTDDNETNSTEPILRPNKLYPVGFDTENVTIRLSAIGLGGVDERLEPTGDSEGRVVIAQTQHPECLRRYNGVLTLTAHTAVVETLVLNISLLNGLFRYQDGYPQPAGVGFSPTCDDLNRCMLDTTQVCIGDVDGRMNCARCLYDLDLYNATEMVNQRLQVWLAYYGTDARGRQLRSGASSPMNFLSGVGTAVSNALYESFLSSSEGLNSGDDDSLEPNINDL